MRAALLVALVACSASAQVFPQGGGTGSGGSCTLDPAEPAVADYFRATATSGTGYQCDATLASCVDLGPGARNVIGTNALGEILLGPETGSGTVVRVYGDVFGSNIIQASGAFDAVFNGTLFNSWPGMPLAVNDNEGFKVTCKVVLPVCDAAMEASTVPLCGTGGAVTKHCLCTGDGTTYAWRNLLNPGAGAGTTTTCPAT